jgi:pimeloyl-ACP methyl ester carboxylesterase
MGVTAVLLPGMDGSGEFFSDFAAALAPEIDSIVVSYPDRELGYEELEAFAREALPSRRYILVGESFSGPIAIGLAASAPAGLLGVVLVCSFARSPMPLPTSLQRMAVHLPMRAVPAWIAGRMLLGRFSTPDYRDKLSSSIARVRAAVWRARIRAILSVDVIPQLRRIDMPILYLRASEDRVVPPAATDLVVRNAKDLRVADLDGPHFLLQVRPQESAAHVKAFARRLAG